VSGTAAYKNFRQKQQKQTVRSRPNFGHRPKTLLNAYRILLTRARQRMIVFVLHGAAQDPN
jgi:hypothetical protein